MQSSKIQFGNMVLGVDIGKTKIAVGVVDVVAKSVAFFLQKNPHAATKDAILETLAFLIDAALKKHQTTDIGVGTFGVVNHTKGVVVSSGHIADWYNLNLASFLRNRFGFTNIVIDNDVVAAAAGEYWLNYEGKNITVISVGTSIGVGSIFDGKVFRGLHNLSGQIAHLKNYNSELTISQLCGGNGISDRLYNESGVRVTTKEVIEMAQDNDSVTKVIVNDAAKTIAQVIMFTQNMIAPEVIVCSGSVLNYNDYFYNLVLSYLEDYPKCYRQSDVEPLNIIKSNLNQYIGILGCVALCKKIVK
ncbi:hypothetical protein FACS1894214_2390 [Planctomycetales bacterium]|nr:hypothetical protein FACS1894214_2390 [Planctomycetales bacterium]